MKFCAKCGRKGETREGLCKKCYSELHPAVDVSKEIVIKVCGGCNKAFHRNRWSRYVSMEEMIEGIVKERLKTKIKNIKAIIKGDKIVAEVKKDDEVYLIPVKIEMSECERCKKEATKYFEGTLQLRNIDEKVIRYVMKELDKERGEGVFVKEMKDVKNGADIELTSQKYLQQLGAKLKKRFGGEVKLTRTLFTRDKQTSKAVYRITLLYKQRS
ncbi:hypothetical protein KY345_05650 [Candidatus Woesearchaeota archaeon]|nr:hypothetical protein [Candidatus Woesearchaeota archaeon]